jgi:hypothetical protein
MFDIAGNGLEDSQRTPFRVTEERSSCSREPLAPR